MVPGMPSGWQADDVLICACYQGDNVVSTMPSPAWTQILGQNNGVTSRMSIWWRRAEVGDTAPTITHAAGNTGLAWIAAFSGALTSGTPVDNPSGTTWASANASSATCTSNAFTPTEADEEILFVAGWEEDLAVTFTAGSNPALTERVDVLTALGSTDATLAMASGVKTDTTLIAARTCSGPTDENIGALFGIKVAAEAPPAALPSLVMAPRIGV
jgi:hypothetical protein